MKKQPDYQENKLTASAESKDKNLNLSETSDVTQVYPFKCSATAKSMPNLIEDAKSSQEKSHTPRLNKPLPVVVESTEQKTLHKMTPPQLSTLFPQRLQSDNVAETPSLMQVQPHSIPISASSKMSLPIGLQPKMLTPRSSIRVNMTRTPPPSSTQSPLLSTPIKSFAQTPPSIQLQSFSTEIQDVANQKYEITKVDVRGMTTGNDSIGKRGKSSIALPRTPPRMLSMTNDLFQWRSLNIKGRAKTPPEYSHSQKTLDSISTNAFFSEFSSSSGSIPEKTIVANQTTHYDYDLVQSPLEFKFSLIYEKEEKNSSALSPLTLSQSVKEAYKNPLHELNELDAENLFQTRLFIFKCLFGDARIQKKCFADFFSSTTKIDRRIADMDKQIFFKFMLQSLNPIRAKMLLGDSADDRQKPYLAEILRYLKEDMRDPIVVPVESYIQSIAERKGNVEFPYDCYLEKERFDYCRHALQQNYEFFEYIFTSPNDATTENELNICKILTWLYHDIGFKLTMPTEDNKASRKLLYKHFKKLLEKDASIHSLANRALFMLVIAISADFINSKTEEKLITLYNVLLESRIGRQLLCRATKSDIEKWCALLGKKWTNVLFEKIIHSFSFYYSLGNPQKQPFRDSDDTIYYAISLLKSSLIQALQSYISPQTGYLFLQNILILHSPKIDMQICENKWLIQILEENDLIEMFTDRIQYCFLFEVVTNTPEIQRAFMCGSQLIVGARMKLKQLYHYSILSTEQIKTINNTEFAIELNKHKKEWLNAYKRLWSIVLNCWRVCDRDLVNIMRIMKEWKNLMIARLLDGDEDAYDAQHYTLEMLPKEMQAALRTKETVLTEYQQQIDEMTTCYQRITECRQNQVIKRTQRYPSVLGYESLITLIKALAAKNRLNGTGEQIQTCAELLSQWIYEYSISLNLSENDTFSDLNPKQFDGAAEIFYISTQYYPLFLNLLEEKSVITNKSSKSMFAPSDIYLKETKTKMVIKELLSVIAEQKMGLVCMGHVEDPPKLRERKI